MVKRWFALSALWVCLSLRAVWAQAPSTIGYQGVLTDNSGVAVANGSYSLSFSLYSAATGGSALWSETQSVTTTSGVFNAVLGSVTPLNVAFTQPLFLGISVGGSELSPRLALSAAPYSLMAKGVEDGAVSGSKLADSAVSTAKLQDGAVGSAKIADGAVATADLADNAVTGAKVAGGQVVKSVNSLTDAVTLAAGSNVTITPSGNTLTIAAASTVADNAVTSAKIADGTIATADLADNTVTGLKISSGQVVKSVNSLTDAVTLAAGSNVTITPSGNTLTIAATGGSGSTLDQAYDQGGAGAGRTITADAGAVNIAGADGLTVNGNVGIGTTSPASALWVNSPSTDPGIKFLRTNSPVAGDVVSLNFGHGTSGLYAAYLQSNLVTASNTVPDADIQFGSRSAGTFVTFKNTGNVGIGTTSPGAKLHIVGNTALTLEEAGATTRTLAFVPPQISAAGSILGNSANGLNIGVSAAGDLNLVTNNTTRATIQSGGNVGIGTTSPTSPLHVDKSQDATTTLWVTNANAGAAARTGFALGQATSGGNYGFIEHLGSGFTTDGLRVADRTLLHGTDTQGLALVSYDASAPMIFATGGYATANERMRITSAGNVGIGTTSPAYKLDVAGVGRFTGGAVNIVGSGGNAELSIVPEAGTPDGTISTEATGGALRFRTRNSGGAIDERMRISSEGNVGIGTTSPANLLTIQQTSATDPIADAWTVYSSRRWKTNIQTLKDPLGKVQRLRGVSYQWKADNKQDVGLIAEEVGEVIPEVVAYEENGKDAKSVDYARLVAVLIEAVKEQQREIEALRERVEGVERAAASGRLSAKAGE